MTDWQKLAVCAGLSVLAHVALSRGLDHLPEYVVPPLPRTIEVRIETPPPPPPPPEPPPPDPTPPPLTKPVHEAPHQPPVHATKVAEQPKDTPPPEHAPTTTDTTDTPVYGWSMNSTSSASSGPQIPIGNTPKPQPHQGSAAHDVKPLAEPVAAFQATKLPLPQGRCFGKYTDEARTAGVEGVVVLDVVVGEDGRVRDVAVTEHLGHGLDEAAIAAVKACRFTPGEKDGTPVPVRVRGFKIRFVLAEAQ